MGDGVDLVQEYKEYLERFEEAAGPAEFGAFVKYSGSLVKKLRFDEFEEAYTDYYDIARTYLDSLDRGDTINDVVVKLLRERASQLFLTSPV
jgi:hypothetical protein